MKIIVDKCCNQEGFSLIEVVIALVILLIALLGVFYTFSFAIGYNSSNGQRSEALALLQQEIESLESAKFTPTLIDQTLTGGEKTAKVVTTLNGNVFLVEVTVDDDPFTNGIQVDSTKTLKEIKISVKNENSFSLWQMSVPAKVVFRRVRGY